MNQEKVFYLEGLSCANCAAKIESSLKNDDRFKEVNFSFATKKLSLVSDHSVDATLSLISDTCNKIEDGIKVVDESNYDKTNESKHVKKSYIELVKDHKWSLLGFLILAITVGLGEDFSYQLFAYIPAYILIGGSVAYKAFRNILKGQVFDENFLMTIATIGAFALGEYLEAVSVMLFYKIGEGFQDYAVDHTRRSIKSLMNIKAEYANLMIGDVSKKVNPKELSIGDTILIKPGEKIPVDASVTRGKSTLDTSALTGESMPSYVEEGTTLLSGSINIDGTLIAIVDKTFKNSTVAKILDMVENATSKKAKTEQFITKFAKIYTPIVVFSAAAMATIPPLLGYGEFRDWLSRSLIFLVISCPCALVLSVPLGYFGGLGAASRSGILVKGGNYLEALNTIDTFAFDKTGTLTKGNFKVVEHIGDDTLHLAALIEAHSTHPIANSIVSAYGRDVNITSVVDVQEIPGEGLVGLYEDKQLIVGNGRLMNRYHIHYTDKDFIGTIVHVAYDNHYIGAAYIADEIKDGAKSLSRYFKHHPAKEILMLTGDQEKIANHVGASLGLKKIYSELLPGDKLSTIEGLIDEGKLVLFVGDGINDAPVLARADIGVAMGGVGSDAAIEAADIVIMNDDPSKILDAMTISKKTRNIVIQNIVFALGIKLLFLSLGATGHANMYQAIFADVGVALIAVINSMRTLRIKL
jgi:Cd2+/Zn2+-exporting ATPase